MTNDIRYYEEIADLANEQMDDDSSSSITRPSRRERRARYQDDRVSRAACAAIGFWNELLDVGLETNVFKSN